MLDCEPILKDNAVYAPLLNSSEKVFLHKRSARLDNRHSWFGKNPTKFLSRYSSPKFVKMACFDTRCKIEQAL
jgi:hypothetical protein